VNVRRFKIVVENFPKSSQNIVLMLEIAAFVTNVVPHLVEINQEVVPKHVNPQSSFIELNDSPMWMECLQSLFAHQPFPYT
jgi:hypothetical protein